jgi:DNA-binding transcriptional MerR regulator
VTTAPESPGRFTRLQAGRLARCSGEQLDYWSQHGVVVPAADGTYDFRDLVALRMIASLLDAGVPLRRVRRAVQALGEHADDVTELRLVAEGDEVYACRGDGEILDALRHGQLALFIPLDAIAADVRTDVAGFDRERQSFVADLRAADDPAGTA